jgi:RNA polymerase sigma-70 factor (ECF subfamily)
MAGAAHHLPVTAALPFPALNFEATVDRRARLESMINGEYRFIWRLLRRLGVPEDHASDAVQQVFLIAAERIDDIRDGSERSFLFGTAVRLSQTSRRKLAREIPREDPDVDVSPLPSPEELSDQKRAREVLDRVLDEMPMDLRTVFVLFELEGLTSPEIAKVVEVPLGTVASRLRRGRDLFRQLVEREMNLEGGVR